MILFEWLNQGEKPGQPAAFQNNITRAGQISILHFDYTKQRAMKFSKIKVYIIYIIRPWDGERIGLLLTIKIN